MEQLVKTAQEVDVFLELKVKDYLFEVSEHQMWFDLGLWDLLIST
jgi:hypothetical protein